jgi:subtilisin-like proprotein convertase family protein
MAQENCTHQSGKAAPARHFYTGIPPEAGNKYSTLLVWSIALMFAVSCPGLLSGAVMSETDRYQVFDSGQLRHFELALDELGFAGPLHTKRVAAFSTAEQLRQYARDQSQATRQEVELVLYELGRPHSQATRRIATKQLLVQLAPDTDPKALAQAWGLIVEPEQPAYAPGYFIFRAQETGGALFLAQALRQQAGILRAEALLAKQPSLKFVPNDTLFSSQWHLLNTGQNGGVAGIDINVTEGWNSHHGAGVTIGIVDVGLQYTHPDLSANVNTSLQWDWNDNDADPTPNGDPHGTGCAGVAAARGNNGMGVSGVAFEATLVGLRLLGGPVTDAQMAGALSHSNNVISIKSNSWGPSDDGLTLEGPGPLTLAALAGGAQTGRQGRGTIYVWAGGNGLAANDNANYDGYVNSIYTIGVAALDDQGNQASYSEPGACLVVTAPSSGGGQRITSTDLTGYSSSFGGTSMACPAVSGVVALLLEANPNLGWRDVQEILMRSATKIKPADPDWISNGAGLHFNHKFGAGLVNATAALNLAGSWTNLGSQISVVSEQSGLAFSIPDNNASGLTRSFDLSGSHLRVEHVTLSVNIAHSNRGNLAITLTSPSGTESRLAEKHSDSGDNYVDWKFMSVHHWAENSAGIWTVRIADLAAGETGSLSSLRLEVYGTQSAQGPSLSAINDQLLLEDHASAALDLSVGDPDTALDQLVLSGSSSNPGLIPAENISFGGTGSARTLIVRPAADQFGSAIITVTVSDGTSSVSRSFTVNVVGVNDPPSFNAGNSQTVLENGGAQTVLAWATAIRAGPTNEAGQKIEFLVSNDNNALFSVQPALSSDGTLTYTPAAEVNGMAQVTVQLHDNGGTANNGLDASNPVGFTVTVLANDEDADGDGFTNLQEFMAGTDPLDPADALGITTEQLENEARISFRTVFGKHYRLEYNNSFPDLDWAVLIDNIEGTGAIVEVVDSESANQSKRFYRVALLP